MPLLFLSAPGIGTRYSDSYSEHLPAVVRSRKREAIITYKKIRPMIQLDNLSYRLISPYNDKGVFSLMLYTLFHQYSSGEHFVVQWQRTGIFSGLVP